MLHVVHVDGGDQRVLVLQGDGHQVGIGLQRQFPAPATGGIDPDRHLPQPPVIEVGLVGVVHGDGPLHLGLVPRDGVHQGEIGPHVEVQREDAPEGSFPDELLQVLHHRMEVVGEPHAEDPATGLGRLEHSLGLSQAVAHGLFAKHVAPDLERPNRHFGMQSVGCGDHHHFRASGQQALEGRMGRNLTHFPQGPLQVVGMGFAQLHRELRPGRQHAGVPASDGSAADHCNAPLGHSPPAFQIRSRRR